MLPFRHVRFTLTLVLVAALGLATVAFVDARQVASAEAVAAERDARLQLGRDMTDLRRGLREPASDARTATTDLRTNLADLVGGAERDPEAMSEQREELLQTLRTAADELDERAEPGLPEVPRQLPAEDVAPLHERFDGLDAQAGELADQLRVAADDTERWSKTAAELRLAAMEFVSLDLPSTDDPEELADTWRDQASALSTYRGAARDAADSDGLEAIGAAHLRLVDGLQDLATDAADHLGDSDVEAYNDLLADQLGDDDPFGFRTALTEAFEETVEAGPIPEIEAAHERALGLLSELEELGRATRGVSASQT